MKIDDDGDDDNDDENDDDEEDDDDDFDVDIFFSFAQVVTFYGLTVVQSSQQIETQYAILLRSIEKSITKEEKYIFKCKHKQNK